MKVAVQFQILSLSAIIGFVAAAAVGKLPPTFKVCKKSAPKFRECVQVAVEKAIQDLVKGYPPLGIYSIDPLEITAIDIDQGKGPVSINLKFRDLKIFGVKTVQIKHLNLENLGEYKFAGRVRIPKLTLKGKYMIDGKVLILPITGNGNCLLTLDDVEADIEILGKEVKKDGKMFMKVAKFDFKLETKKLGINLENLFNGDKALGDNMNRFLNENWSEILKELKPAIQDTFGAAFAEISNRIFMKVPYEDIFPN